jgi:hypothetical protein
MKYTGGEKKMIMPTNVRIVLLVPATLADIKAGQYFFGARRQASVTGYLGVNYHCNQGG